MELQEIIIKLRIETNKLKRICDTQFEERFSTSKHQDSWQDELFKEYQTIMIRIELLQELLES